MKMLLVVGLLAFLSIGQFTPLPLDLKELNVTNEFVNQIDSGILVQNSTKAATPETPRNDTIESVKPEMNSTTVEIPTISSKMPSIFTFEIPDNFSKNLLTLGSAIETVPVQPIVTGNATEQNDNSAQPSVFSIESNIAPESSTTVNTPEPVNLSAKSINLSAKSVNPSAEPVNPSAEPVNHDSPGNYDFPPTFHSDGTLTSFSVAQMATVLVISMMTAF